MTPEERANPQLGTADEARANAMLGAASCRVFYDALLAHDFTADQAILIVASWYGSARGTDAATQNAVYANFAETLVAALKADGRA